MSYKKVTFDKIGEGLLAFTAEGDTDPDVIIRGHCVMIIEALTIRPFGKLNLRKGREATDKTAQKRQHP